MLNAMGAVSAYSYGDLWLISSGEFWHRGENGGWNHYSDELDGQFLPQGLLPVLKEKIGGRKSQFLLNKSIVTWTDVELSSERTGIVRLIAGEGCYLRNSAGGICLYVIYSVNRSVVASRISAAFSRVAVFIVIAAFALAAFTVVLALLRYRRLLDIEEARDKANIFNENPAPIIRFSADGKLSRANKAASELFNLDLEKHQQKKTVAGLFPEFSAESFYNLPAGSYIQFEKNNGASTFLMTVKRSPESLYFLWS